jgi:hypothetical protein
MAVTDPKAPPAPVTWFELPAQYAFHVANAWEDEAGRVHLFACTFPEFSFNFNAPNRAPPPESERQRLTEYVLDPATGAATATPLTSVYCDFPVVHPGLVGYRSRWAWGATFDYKAVTVEAQGVAKYDLAAPPGTADACVGRIRFPEGSYGGVWVCGACCVGWGGVGCVWGVGVTAECLGFTLRSAMSGVLQCLCAVNPGWYPLLWCRRGVLRAAPRRPRTGRRWGLRWAAAAPHGCHQAGCDGHEHGMGRAGHGLGLHDCNACYDVLVQRLPPPH